MLLRSCDLEPYVVRISPDELQNPVKVIDIIIKNPIFQFN
jgi:hypothetical protein